MRFGTGIILAGGKSARMGFDKQRIELEEGRLLIRAIIENLAHYFEDVIIVTQRSDLYQDLKVRTTSDHFLSKGPLAGIHAGLVASNSQMAFVIGCDMPYFDPTLNQMMEACDRPGAQIISLKTPFRFQALYAYYNKNLVGSIENILNGGGGSVFDLLVQSENVLCDGPEILERMEDKQVLLNINRPQDLEAFLKNRQ